MSSLATGKVESFYGTSILINDSGFGVKDGVLALSGDSWGLHPIPKVRISWASWTLWNLSVTFGAETYIELSSSNYYTDQELKFFSYLVFSAAMRSIDSSISLLISCRSGDFWSISDFSLSTDFSPSNDFYLSIDPSSLLNSKVKAGLSGLSGLSDG